MFFFSSTSTQPTGNSYSYSQPKKRSEMQTADSSAHNLVFYNLCGTLGAGVQEEALLLVAVQ